MFQAMILLDKHSLLQHCVDLFKGTPILHMKVIVPVLVSSTDNIILWYSGCRFVVLCDLCRVETSTLEEMSRLKIKAASSVFFLFFLNLV